MRKILTLILILCSIAAIAEMRGGALYDPGAIRSDGTNASDTVTLNRVRTATGTAAAPAYSFSSDPDTGIYSPGADSIGFGVGGVDVASLSSTGLSLGTPLSVANGGTAATDAATARTNLGVAYGTAAGTVCQGNDARLSDARTPVAHAHSGADITSGTVADARIDASICRDSELTTHGNLTAAHGATGAVVGTTNTQTVTNKTMGSGCSWDGTAIPVANGGTGATTAAAGLAALGGASLNGSSTVDFSVNHAKAGDGSAAAPAYTFSSDPDTGIYSPGANTIGFSAAGSQVATISSIGVTAPNITDLMGYTGYMPANVYGVEINLATPSAPTFTRLAGAVGKTPGADFNGINAFNRRRCNLSDAGVVNKYYGEDGYTEDGSNGQVMVEQPRFYYKVVPLVTSPIANGIGSHVTRARYYISDTMIDGFKLHPAFIKDGVERPVIYLSAYEGSIYDTSASAYLLADEQVADFTATTGDTLCSIAGAKPASGLTQNLTRANSRQLAANRGAKWSLATVQSVSASQLLFLVEYASFNTQAAIGRGVTDKTDDGATNMSNVTGATTALGNGSGAAVGTNGLVSITYRGEENFWGNIWKWVDGFNVQGSSLHYAWIADHDFADDTTTGYTNAGFTLAKANGYVSAFGYANGFDWLFLPSAVAGSDSNPVGDQFYQNNTATGFLVAQLGGSWDSLSYTGGCYWALANASSHRYRYVGARSLHVP